MARPNDRLRETRIKRYKTAQEAAEAMGVKVPTYIQHENGTRGSGSIPRAAAERYAAFFRVSLDWLLSGKGDGPQPDPIPSLADLETMIATIVDDEVTFQTKLSDLPHIVASGLHEQLRHYQSGLASRAGEGGKPSLDKGAQSPAPKKPGELAG